MIRGFFNQRTRLPSGQRLKLGVCAHPFLISEYGSNQTLQFQLMNDAGLTEYRFALPVNSSGTVTSPSKLTEILSKAITYNINLYPILTTAVDFTLSEATNYSNGFTRGAGFVTGHSSTFSYIEIGNEIENTFSPFTGDGSNIAHFNNDKYVRARSFIKGMIDGIKSVNASIKCVVNSGDKHWGYVSQLLIDGCSIDVIAWHWYSDMEDNYVNQIIQKLLTLFTQEIWFNEVNSRNTDGSVQATFLNYMRNYINGYRVSKMFVYELFNEPNHSDTTERNYGMAIYNSTTGKALLKNSAVTFKMLRGYAPSTVLTRITSQLIASFPYLTAVYDNTYGYLVKITRITNDGSGHGYSKLQYWNADHTLLKLNNQALYNGSTYAPYKTVSITSVSHWSNLRSNILYDFGNYRITEVDVTTNPVTRTEIYNFTSEGFDDGNVQVGDGEGRTDINDQYVMLNFMKAGVPYYILFDLKNRVVVSRKTKDELAPNNDINWTSVSQLAGYIIVNRTTTGSFTGGKDVYRLDWTFVRTLPSWSHADCGIDTKGKEVLTTGNNPQYADMETGTITTVVSSTLMNTVFNSSATHSCCANFNLPGYMVVSHFGTSPLYPEIMLMKLDSTGEVRRIVPVRTEAFDYANEAQASTDRDGKRVLFTAKVNGVTAAFVAEYLQV